MIHSNLDLGAVNLGVYLDLVANSLLTEILLIKNSEFRRFRQNQGPRFRRRSISRKNVYFHLFLASIWDFGAKIMIRICGISIIFH